MGLTASKPLPRPPVPEGKTRLCVAGFGISHHTGRAREIADKIVQTYPDKYESWYYFDTTGFRPEFLDSIKEELSHEQQLEFAKHNTSPFCWIETSDAGGAKPIAIGGRDDLCDWAVAKFEHNHKNEAFLKRCKKPGFIKDMLFDNSTPGTASTK
jgi:hypothetical protein